VSPGPVGAGSPVSPGPVGAGSPVSSLARAHLDRLVKPPGSLGSLEDLAVRLAGILGSARPHLHDPQVLVCAADHGIAAHGVSAYPSTVTRQMIGAILSGGAAVSVLARLHDLPITVVDCGVADPDPTDRPPAPNPPAAGATLIVAPIASGTADATCGPAMSAAQCTRALDRGREILRGLPGNVVLTGELGIGNTSAASLLMARLTGEPLSHCVGSGTGVRGSQLDHKRAVLQRVLTANLGADQPEAALAALGGFEIAVLTGVMLEAATQRRVILVDGFVTTAAVAVAAALQPAVIDACIFSHVSAEHGHARWLQYLGATPLLDLRLRLGEATGAILAWPLLCAATRVLTEMATLDGAGVSGPQSTGSA